MLPMNVNLFVVIVQCIVFFQQSSTAEPLLHFSTDGVYCHDRCAHFKLLESSGCCRCNCRLGYSINADKKSCSEASWKSWSLWSSCIKSPWGGLQQRWRICVSDDRVSTGRCIGKGSQEKRCTKITTGFRIRKNIRRLNNWEKHDLIQAFSQLKKQSSPFGYQSIAKWHGWPFMCPWNKQFRDGTRGHCSWHNHPLFLSWHRLITVQLELALGRYLKNKNLGIPYWDWTEENWSGIPNFFANPTIYDPILKREVNNPFYRTFIKDPLPPENETIFNHRLVNRKGISYHSKFLKGIVRAINMPNYASFDSVLEESHNRIHDCMCHFSNTSHEYCKYSMRNVEYASFDPMFFFHHSQVDRLFVLYKTLHDKSGDQDWSEDSFIRPYMENYGFKFRVDILQAFEWPISPFCNKSMNLETITSNPEVWKVKNAYFSQALFGYKYDSLNLGGYLWKRLLLDLKVKKQGYGNGLKISFVSHLSPSLGEIIRNNTSYNTSC